MFYALLYSFSYCRGCFFALVYISVRVHFVGLPPIVFVRAYSLCVWYFLNSFAIYFVLGTNTKWDWEGSPRIRCMGSAQGNGDRERRFWGKMRLAKAGRRSADRVAKVPDRLVEPVCATSENLPRLPGRFFRCASVACFLFLFLVSLCFTLFSIPCYVILFLYCEEKAEHFRR